MKLEGAKALVTGGGGGLGSVLMRRLAERGVDVATAFREGADRAEAAAEAARAEGVKAATIQMDLADPASIEAGVDAAAEALGGLDILINNAGVASGGLDIPVGDLDAFTPEIWDDRMAVNVRGPYLAARAAAARLRASKWGRIVNIGSTIGEGTWGAGTIYAPSKSAAAALTRYLAAALAPDVTVNCVAPGLMEGTLMSGGAPETYVKPWRDRAILGRTTSIEDVATHTLAFCESETTTGQVLIVDAGVHF